MSSATESFCPACGIEPSSNGGACAGCQNDQRVMSALESWTESTALQSTFTVRGVNLTRTLIYPLMKAVIEELVREANAKKA